jgi:aspartate/methionine/tyrosine aminotransferase
MRLRHRKLAEALIVLERPSLPIFARRMGAVGFSASQASIARIKIAREAGETVHDFSSKFDTPDHVKQAATAYLASPKAALYADPRGLPELRSAIARKLKRENGICADADNEITVTPGGKQGILTALLALAGPGDQVLLEDPGWLSFEPMVRLTGARAVPVRLREGDGFALDLDLLARKMSKRTRVLVLCNPHNPTGRVFSTAELYEIARFVLAQNLMVIMDEAYEHFMFDGLRHVSLASLPCMRDRVITAQTCSKTFNMFGWRVGWLLATPAISERIRIVSVHSVTCVTSFAQAGAAAALDGTIVQGSLTLAELTAAYQQQRDAMVDGLRAIEGVRCFMPQGAYFVFPDISHFGLTSEALSQRLFAEARVSANPGSVFGRGGEGHLRLVFNAQLPEIEAGLAALQRCLRNL